MSALAAPNDPPERVTHIIQGAFAVSGDRDTVFATVLGSCVAACLHDRVAGVGGMNHFLLPGDEHEDSTHLRYGVHAMELLINGMLGLGAKRDRMEAKLFGGARVVHGLSDVGEQNAEFATRFLREEGIALASESLGGEQARRVQFWPATGRARQMALSPHESMALLVRPARAPKPADSGAVELF